MVVKRSEKRECIGDRQREKQQATDLYVSHVTSKSVGVSSYGVRILTCP